jgi:hypothetical protein
MYEIDHKDEERESIDSHRAHESTAYPPAIGQLPTNAVSGKIRDAFPADSSN